MRKQLELDFSCIKDLRDDVKNQIKEHIEKGNYTLSQLNSIYRHIYVSTEKSKPLQKRSGHVYFIYKGTNLELRETLNLEANEQKYSYFPKDDDHMMDYNENLLKALDKFLKSI